MSGDVSDWRLPGNPGAVQATPERWMSMRRVKELMPGKPVLTEQQILRWADAYHHRTKTWPTSHSGDVSEARGENWRSISEALRLGYRGLPGGSSLAQLLAQKRGVRNQRLLPRLSVEEILAWADAFKARTGDWPRIMSGAIPEEAGETWKHIDFALRFGHRGLPKGGSLRQLLAEHRGVRRNNKGAGAMGGANHPDPAGRGTKDK